MIKPWADGPLSEWCLAQARNGFRANSAEKIPGDGIISSRRWFSWRDANAVTVFGLNYTRDLLRSLGEHGVTSTDSWLDQTWHPLSRYRAGRQTFMDAHGLPNAYQLAHTVHLGADVNPFLLEHVVGSDAPSNWIIETQGNRLTVTSPGYYCRYKRAGAPSFFTSRHWPIDPADEREPAVYDEDPRARPRRSNVPKAAEAVIADIRKWGIYLGFTLARTPGGQWRKSSPGRSTYTVETPVTLKATPAEIYERSQPYEGAVTVAKGPREPSAPHIHGRSHLINFNARRGFRAWITDPNADGRYTLTVESSVY